MSASHTSPAELETEEQEMETLEETVTFEDLEGGTSPAPYAFPPGVLNGPGVYSREEAVSESSEQLSPEEPKKRR